MKKHLIILLLAAGFSAAGISAKTINTNKAILGINSGTNEIKVKAVTADGSQIQVEGCTVTNLASGKETFLTATGTTVTLSGNMIKIDCSGNALTLFELQGLSVLQELDCSENNLTSLEVKSLPALKELDCSKNQLTSLTLQDLPLLEELDCSNNQLASFDARNLIALEELDCTKNQLTSLEIQGIKFLKELKCSCNQLTEQSFIQIFNGLPKQKSNNAGKVYVYDSYSNVNEENIAKFISPADLSASFKKAKAKNWKLYKRAANGEWQKI